MCFKK
jgi:hypothetical protein